jgi:hypothetical protein
MNEWLKRIIQTLLVIVFIAAIARLAWELLRPAVPTFIGLLVVLLIIRVIWRRPQGW